MKYLKKVITLVQLGCMVTLLLILGNSSGVVKTQKTNANLNKTIDLIAMSNKIEEIVANDIYAVKETIVGSLTGYAADCPLCNGHLGCTGQDVRDKTVTYNDSDYGTLRIVAASQYNLACGSVVKIDYSMDGEDEIYAIVLDRGVGGTALDLLVESESYAYKYVGRRDVTYDVLRYGWKRSE